MRSNMFAKWDMITDNEGWQRLLECRRSQIQWRVSRTVEDQGPPHSEEILQTMGYGERDFF